MSLAVSIVVTLVLAQGAPAFAPDAQVTRDPASGLVRQASAARIPVASSTLQGLVAGFFAPLRAELGVDPVELVETRREAWNGGTSIELQRVVDGHEVVDGVLRVTLGADGLLQSYAAGDVAPVTRPTSPLIDVAEAVVAAQKVLAGLGDPGSSDLVYLGGKLAWRLRYSPAPAFAQATSDEPAGQPRRPARGLSVSYAPVVFVDAASGELLALRNGLVR
jgi:hypothetical protein